MLSDRPALLSAAQRLPPSRGSGLHFPSVPAHRGSQQAVRRGAVVALPVNEAGGAAAARPSSALASFGAAVPLLTLLLPTPFGGSGHSHAARGAG